MDSPAALASLVRAVIETQPSGLTLAPRLLHLLARPFARGHGHCAGHTRKVGRLRLVAALLAVADYPAVNRTAIPRARSVGVNEWNINTEETAQGITTLGGWMGGCSLLSLPQD